MQLIKVCQNVWIMRQAPSSFSFYNVVMTIVRLKDDSLMLYNPLEPREDLVKKLNHLGCVSSIIIPSCLRCSYLDLITETFPEAMIYTPNKIPQRATKNLDAKNSIELKAGKGYPWDRELEFMQVEGMPLVNESIFYHKKSSSLILSDLLVLPKAFPQPFKWINKLFFRGKENSLLKQNLFYKFCIRNSILYQKSFNKLKNWDIKRVVLSRGGVFDCSSGQVYDCVLSVV